MKKIYAILFAALTMLACDSENLMNDNDVRELIFDITVNYPDATKATKTGWEDGDVIYAFFSTVAAPKYLKMTYDASAGSWTKVQYNGASAEAFDIPSPGVMTAVFLPYGNDETVSADGTNFVFGNTYTSYYLKAEKAAFTVTAGVVSSTLNMLAPEGLVQFAMPIFGTIDEKTAQFFREVAGYYTLSENNITPFSLASVAADGTISNTAGYNAGDPITGYYYGTGNDRCINFSGILSAAAKGTPTAYSFYFVNNRGTANEYDDVTYILSGTKTLSYRSAVKFPLISSSAWKVPEPEWVEINGKKWAKWNVGASCVGGYGDFYDKNDPFPKASYSTSTEINATYNSANDVATQKLGSDWHMPNALEIASIFSYDLSDSGNNKWNTKITAKWISNTSTYGTVGWEITDKSNHNSIFIPAAGLIIAGTSWIGEGGSADIWNSSSLYFEYLHSGGDFYEVMMKNGESKPAWAYSQGYGLSVRPIHN